uniref:uncharacterized protein lrrfip1a isoform X9 n=1 Tax=Doryrhamphus excisus TaxID=161450 RepID=UPI0025AE1637|nr:uncharacterized protein lrrfip1a isoform X9 [Doryrhamphus excisus]
MSNMGSQGTGRKRSSNKDRSTAEDDALNLIAKEAEARLAAKRAARAEAREIRMRELERQQKEEDSERYSRPSQMHTLSDDDERLSVGSRGSVRGSSLVSHKKSKKKKKHKHKDKDRNGYDDEYSVVSSRSSRLSDDSRVSRSSRGDLLASYASSDLYSLNGLSSTRNTGSTGAYQSALYEDSHCSGSQRVTGSGAHSLEYSSYHRSNSRTSSRANSARTSPVDNCGSVASYLRSSASSGGLLRDLDDVTIPDFSDADDKDYLEKGSRSASALTATTLTSLGGSSSRRGSVETAITVDAEAAVREIKEIHELKDQIQDVESKYTQNLKEAKDALTEVEEKYRKAMVSNAQLDNEKNNLMYQVDTLKDSLMELEELLSESRREYEEKVKEFEREKHAHSVLQFQLITMKETLKQSEELLNEIRQLRMKQDGFAREISDLQETVEWKDKKIGALERQKEYTDAIRIERDELREEVVKLKDILKKHGIVLGPDMSINGSAGETETEVGTSGDSVPQPAQESSTFPAEGNSMLGSSVETQLRSSGKEEVDQEQHQEAQTGHLSSDRLSNTDRSYLAESHSRRTEEQKMPLKDINGGQRLECQAEADELPITKVFDEQVLSSEFEEITSTEKVNSDLEQKVATSTDITEDNSTNIFEETNEHRTIDESLSSKTQSYLQDRKHSESCSDEGHGRDLQSCPQKEDVINLDTRPQGNLKHSESCTQDIKDSDSSPQEDVKDSELCPQGNLKDSASCPQDDVNDSESCPQEDVSDSESCPQGNLNDSESCPQEDVNDSESCPQEDVNDFESCPQGNLKDSESCPQEDVNDSKSCPQEDVNDSKSCPQEDVNDSKSCPQEDVNDSKSCPQEDVNDSKSCPQEDVNDSKSCPQEDVNDSKSCPQEDVNDSGSCPQEDVNDSGSCPQEDVNDSGSCPQEDVNDSGSCPQEDVNDSGSCPQEDVNDSGSCPQEDVNDSESCPQEKYTKDSELCPQVGNLKDSASESVLGVSNTELQCVTESAEANDDVEEILTNAPPRGANDPGKKKKKKRRGKKKGRSTEERSQPKDHKESTTTCQESIQPDAVPKDNGSGTECGSDGHIVKRIEESSTDQVIKETDQQHITEQVEHIKASNVEQPNKSKQVEHIETSDVENPKESMMDLILNADDQHLEADKVTLEDENISLTLQLSQTQSHHSADKRDMKQTLESVTVEEHFIKSSDILVDVVSTNTSKILDILDISDDTIKTVTLEPESQNHPSVTMMPPTQCPESPSKPSAPTDSNSHMLIGFSDKGLLENTCTNQKDEQTESERSFSSQNPHDGSHEKSKLSESEKKNEFLDLVKPENSLHDPDKDEIFPETQAEHFMERQPQLYDDQIDPAASDMKVQTQSSSPEEAGNATSPQIVQRLSDEQLGSADNLEEHKHSQSNQEHLQESTAPNQSKTNNTSQENEEHSEDDEKGQSFDFDDMDSDVAVEIQTITNSQEEEVEVGVDVLSDMLAPSPTKLQVVQENSQEKPMDPEVCADVAPADKDLHVEALGIAEDQKEKMRQEKIDATDEQIFVTKDTPPSKAGEFSVLENTREDQPPPQAVSLSVEEALNDVGQPQGDLSATKMGRNRVTEKQPKNSKKGKSKGKDDCKMT